MVNFPQLLGNFILALRTMCERIRTTPIKWLFYELVPEFWVYGPNWRSTRKEVVGWFFYFKSGGWWFPGHMVQGFLLSFILPWWWAIALYGFMIEIIQLFKAKFTYILPINSLIDISAYVLGYYLYHIAVF